MARGRVLQDFFAQLVTMAGDGMVIQNNNGCVEQVSRFTGKSGAYVASLLTKLEEANYLTKTYSPNSIGRGRLISEIRLLKRVAPTPGATGDPRQETESGSVRIEPSAPRPAAQPRLVPGPATTPAAPAKPMVPAVRAAKESQLVAVQAAPPLPPPQPSSNGNLAAVLVDYDNVCGTAADGGFAISFARLREFCRRFGRVIFADVFVSPRSIRRQEIIPFLWQAGFEVWSCPMERKDKDAVDAKLKSRARKYAEHSSVSRVVIVSEDNDMCADPDLTELVRDLGKEFIVVKPSEYREDLEGEDDIVSHNLGFSRKTDAFRRAIGLVANGNHGGTSEDQMMADLLRDLIREIDRLTSGTRLLSFNPLLGASWATLRPKWQEYFQMQDVKSALSALGNDAALNSHAGRTMTFYKLNYDHPAVIAATSSAVARRH